MGKIKRSDAIALNNDLMETFIKIAEANSKNESVTLTPDDTTKVFAVMYEVMKKTQMLI